jgi:RNA polymerase sigma-70 factor (ECF subfamily)
VHDESDTGLEDRPGIGRDLGRDLADLYHAGYRRLVAQVFAFTTDLNEAQDAVQEAFARALARPRGLAGVDAPEAWLRTVAINVVRRRWRRKQILNTLLLRERPLVRAFEEPPEPERADLREALATLPRAYREVIVLHYLADLPVDEVAAILEVPVGTVKSRLSRGREALKGLLDDVQAPPLAEVRQRAGRIRTRRRATKAALALLAASATGFFWLRPAPLAPVAPHPTPSVALSYSADGILIRGIFDPATAPDLPGTITSFDMVAPAEGWLSTSEGTLAHTVDGGLTWTLDSTQAPTKTWSDPGFPLVWRSPRQDLGAGFDHGVATVWMENKKIVLNDAVGDGLTGTIRDGKVVVMTLQGTKISGVYEGDAKGFRKASSGADVSIVGEPILLADDRLLIADDHSHWLYSTTFGDTWHQTETGLPDVGSLRATQMGYVALDLFRFGWVAISPDGLIWQKLPIR